MRPRSVYLALSLLAAAPAALTAQAVTGALEGRVLSAGGEALDAASVTVSGPFLQGSRTITTDPRGWFIYLALPPGTYEVVVRRMGYRPATVGRVAVRLGSTTGVGEVRLEPTAVEMTPVEVSGARPLLDPLSTAAATTLDSSFFRRIPTPRDFMSLAELAPATGPDPFSGVLAGGAGLQVGGATEAENGYFVDGVNATQVLWGAGSDVNLPFNFVREVQVLTGAYEAEYGRAEGGVVNAVTNSGGNEFHAQLLGYFSDNSFQATPRRGMSDVPTASFGNWDVGGSVSGPIQRDRLWYHLSYNPTFKYSTVSYPEIPAQRAHETVHPLAGKLTWRAGPATDVSLTVLAAPGSSLAFGGGEEASSVLHVANREAVGAEWTGSGTTAALELRHQFGRSLLTAAASYSGRRDEYTPLGPHGTLAELAQVSDYRTNTLSGSNGMFTERTTRRTSLRIALTHVAGQHTLKAGAEYQASWVSWRFLMSFLSVSAEDTVRPYSWVTSESLMEGYNHVPTVFAQDSWEVSPHLRINAGLRWEGQWLGGPTGSAPGITNQFAPRLGVVIQPGRLGREKFTASYGRFYQQVSSVAPGYWYGTGVNLTTAYASNPLAGSVPGDTLSRYVQGSITPEPHMRGPSYDEFTVGYQRLLTSELKVAVRAVARSLNWAIDDMFPGEGAAFGNPGRGVMARVPRAVKEYRALELSLERSGPGPLAFIASYVLSRNRGNYPGIWDQDLPGNPSGGSSTMSYDNPDDGPHLFSGPLPNDRTHLFKLVGSYRWGTRALVGASFLLASGTPRSEQGAGAWGLPFYVTFVDGRGNLGRTPWLWDLNLRCSYLVPVRGGIRPQLVLDVFHVGNPRGEVWYNDIRYDATRDSTGTWPSTNPNFGKVQSYQKPMYARLGMQIDF